MEDGHISTLNLDPLNREKDQLFFDVYELEETIFGDVGKKIYLGTKLPRVCRFCKRTNAEVTFKKYAHVLSQFLGNRNLLSYFECDECNELFGIYEQSFASYFGGLITFAGIKGKSRKVPKYGDDKTGLEVSFGETFTQITIPAGNGQVEIDQENKSIIISTGRSYVPIHIPKILIKIGLCMLQPEDVDDYDRARKFILDSAMDSRFDGSEMLRVSSYFIPGPFTFSKPFAELYKKKRKQSKHFPLRQVILCFANVCLQITLPFAKSEQHRVAKETMIPYPLGSDNPYFELFGKYQTLNLDLTSHKKEKVELTHGFSFASSKKSAEQTCDQKGF
jgi:HNH endonuclease